MTHDLNATQLAGALARTRQTVHLWVRQGLPRNPDKSFSLPAVINWLVERERDALADQGSPNDSPQLERWRAARAELAELELALRKEQLVTVDHVLDAWCARHTMVRDALLSLVNRLPPMLVGLDQIEMREQIEREVDAILEGFAQDGRYTPAAGELPTGIEVAPEDAPAGRGNDVDQGEAVFCCRPGRGRPRRSVTHESS